MDVCVKTKNFFTFFIYFKAYIIVRVPLNSPYFFIFNTYVALAVSNYSLIINNEIAGD